MPFGAQPPQTRTSGLAIASLIAGLIGLFSCVVVIVPLAAIIMGVLGLRQVTNDPTRVQGRGMAISGIVLGVIGLLIGAAFIALFAIGDSTSSSSSTFIDEFFEVPADSFVVGSCTTRPEDSSYADLEPMGCTIPHGGELYHRSDVDSSIDSYPGDDAIFDLADTKCLSQFQPYVGSEYEASVFDVYYFTPDRFTWSQGDREIVCLLMAAVGDMDAGSALGSGI